MFSKLRRWLSGDGKASVDGARLAAETWPSIVYAIGDVHGCRQELDALERRIIDDGKDIAGEKWIVLLGDYVDRGPDSAGVLDKLTGPAPQGFKRICLAGNHETMMLDYLDNPLPVSNWLEFGGNETLSSYGIDPAQMKTGKVSDRKAILESHIPREHVDWLRALPLLLALPGTLFVHAGVRPGVLVDNQLKSDLLWIREPFLSATRLPGGRVIHGHTPAPLPVLTPDRICVDTGAFATGILTAARLSPSGDVQFIDTTNHSDPSFAGEGAA